MMMISSSLRGVAKLAEDFDGPPDDNPWVKWFCGVVLCLLAAVLGVAALVTRGAIGTAVLLISLGLFSHFHFFWSLSRRLQPYSDLAKSIAVTPLVGSLFYGLYYFAARM